MLKIGFVGYGQHARRIDKSVRKFLKTYEVIHYHPIRKEGLITNRLEALFDRDLIFITSPNQTHFHYVREFLDQSNAKIFCEKPPCTSFEEIDYLKNLDLREKERIFFNFNYRHSELCRNILFALSNKTVGDFICVMGSISHGLAFKNEYLESWRGQYPENASVVLDTSLIHFIDLFNYIFNGNLDISSSLGASFSHGYDSFGINLHSEIGVNVFLFSSYAAPCDFSIKILGTNGLIEADNTSFMIKTPRDTFNEAGFFIPPPTHEKENYSFELDYENSLHASVNDFLHKTRDDMTFSRYDFDTSIKTNEIVLVAQKSL